MDNEQEIKLPPLNDVKAVYHDHPPKRVINPSITLERLIKLGNEQNKYINRLVDTVNSYSAIRRVLRVVIVVAFFTTLFNTFLLFLLIGISISMMENLKEVSKHTAILVHNELVTKPNTEQVNGQHSLQRNAGVD